MPEAKIRKAIISGREIFVCDDVIDPAMVQQIGAGVRSLPYLRKEKSRPTRPAWRRCPTFRRRK